MLLEGDFKVFKIKTVRNAVILAMFLIQTVPGLGLRSLQAESKRERVLIRTGASKDAVRMSIETLGGEITHEFKHLDLIAAEIPAAALSSLRALVGNDSISKDAPIPYPDTVFPFPGRGMDTPQGNPLANIPAAGFEQIGDSDAIASFANTNPNSYLINHTHTNVRALHAMGFTGNNVIVAVIDSGLRPGFNHLADGTVVGCEDMLNPQARGRGRKNLCSDDANFGHGTFVVGLIASNAIVSFDEGSLFLDSVTLNAPAAVLTPPSGGPGNGKGKGKNPPAGSVAMLGSAPNAKIHAFRVFDSEALVGNSGDILAAVDRIIELKSQGVNIGVVNMSLGRRSLFAGNGAFELAVDALLANDIVPVVASGNSGLSSMTVASPATGNATLSVGVGSVVHQERILADVLFGAAGFGSFLRPFNGTQIANFSSRGPNADGQIDPNVVANGFGAFSAGLSDRDIDGDHGMASLGAGSSFSSPLAAGIAAVLREAFPGAPAVQILNAIKLSGRSEIVDDGSTSLDQGSGWVDALAAYNLLAVPGAVSDLLDVPPTPTASVRTNVESATDLTVQSGFVHEQLGMLLPGQRTDILYQIPPQTAEVTIRVHGVVAQLPPNQQNAFFGDNILLAVHSAKTSSIVTGDYFNLNPDPASDFAFIGQSVQRTFVLVDQTAQGVVDPSADIVVFDNLEPGILRITLSGDVLNAGEVSANVTISSTAQSASGILTAQGALNGPETVWTQVEMPPDTSQVEFRLEWDGDWSHYPTNDIDLFVYDPDQNAIGDGFTLDAPELILVDNPTNGLWTIGISGFEMNTGNDNWRLRVIADGVVLSEASPATSN